MSDEKVSSCAWRINNSLIFSGFGLVVRCLQENGLCSLTKEQPELSVQKYSHTGIKILALGAMERRHMKPNIRYEEEMLRRML